MSPLLAENLSPPLDIALPATPAMVAKNSRADMRLRPRSESHTGQTYGDKDGAPGLVMPEYGSSFSDEQIVCLAAWLRRTRTKNPPWPDLEAKISRIRRESGTK
jgi:hypothetical protein